MWKTAVVGDTFVMGDGIKTAAQSQAPAAQSQAHLQLADGAKLSLRPEALRRFAPTAEETERGFSLKVGEVFLETGSEPFRLRSAVGLAVIEPGTQVVLRQDGRKTRIEVVVGMANFTPDQGSLNATPLDTCLLELARGTSFGAQSAAVSFRIPLRARQAP